MFRIVQLIDADGCPVDPYVFPALGLSRLELPHFLRSRLKRDISGPMMGWKLDSMHSKYQNLIS